MDNFLLAVSQKSFQSHAIFEAEIIHTHTFSETDILLINLPEVGTLRREF